MKIAVKLGGFSFPLELGVEEIKKYGEMFSKLKRDGNKH
jgi:hypothetical protein